MDGIHPEIKRLHYTYDLMGRLTMELALVGEDAGNVSYRKTSYAYDDNGKRIKETRHGGSYGAEGELLTEGEDLTLTFAYDARNRLVCVEDGQVPGYPTAMMQGATGRERNRSSVQEGS